MIALSDLRVCDDLLTEVSDRDEFKNGLHERT